MSRAYKRHLAYVAICAATALSCAKAQPSPAQPPSLLQLVEDSKKEGGQLDIMNATFANPAFIKAVGEGIAKKFGITVRINVIPGPTPSALAPQIVQEVKAKRRPSTDLFGGDDVNAIVLTKGAAAESVDWRAYDPSIPESAIGPKGEFLRLASRIIGCVWYNTDIVKGEEVPRTLKDLLNPKWKGRLASTTFVAGFREAAGLFGREKEIIDFLSAFRASGNLAGFIRGGQADRVASGEFAMMAVAPVEYPVIKLKEGGAPIDYAVLDEMPNISYWVMSIPRNSSNPNLAKIFSLFMISVEGQRLLYDLERRDLHLLEGSQSAAEYKRVFAGRSPQIVSNEVLLEKWDDYERVAPVLTKAIRGSR